MTEWDGKRKPQMKDTVLVNEHTCHAIACDVATTPSMMMCRRHWYSLPKSVRDGVVVAYRSGQEIDKKPSENYCNAALLAVFAAAKNDCIAVTGDELEVRLYVLFNPNNVDRPRRCETEYTREGVR